MLGFLKKKLPKEKVLFCPECGAPVEERWVDSTYYSGLEILIRDCSSTETYLGYRLKHYYALTGVQRNKLPKFNPYTGEPYGS